MGQGVFTVGNLMSWFLQLIQRMWRLCVWRLEADVRQAAASLALWV
jgi:hypothetical protein